jgi:hypothetical protein
MDLFNDNIKTGILNTVPNDYIILYLCQSPFKTGLEWQGKHR